MGGGEGGTNLVSRLTSLNKTRQGGTCCSPALIALFPGTTLPLITTGFLIMTTSLRYDASIGRFTQERLFPQQLPAFTCAFMGVCNRRSEYVGEQNSWYAF